MARRRQRERDIVAELKEDARWSAYTNEFMRSTGRRPHFRRPRGVGLFTWMLISVVGFVLALGGIAVLLLLFR
ncbi:MAG TPA: hypothetical protein VGR49_08455 [Actinomycetota bacterium]|nr:hypothetical protein [Actinomycetota bacterium]